MGQEVPWSAVKQIMDPGSGKVGGCQKQRCDSCFLNGKTDIKTPGMKLVIYEKQPEIYQGEFFNCCILHRQNFPICGYENLTVFIICRSAQRLIIFCHQAKFFGFLLATQVNNDPLQSPIPRSSFTSRIGKLFDTCDGALLACIRACSFTNL